jgi:tRNA nucleotidyltransferase (CCA-adding enzyme)
MGKGKDNLRSDSGIQSGAQEVLPRIGAADKASMRGKKGLQVITTHINADFDSLASMLAAKKLYPEARVVFPGAQERTLREFLVKSTFYVLDVDRVRDIDLDDVETLILVDTRQRSRIGRFAEIVDRPGVRIHIYDHHPPNEDDLRGEVEVIREVGANTTIMVDLLRRKGLEITPDEATVFALGIYEDTGSLIFSSTKEEDYITMAYLRSRGAKLSLVSDLITRELTAEQVIMLNDLIRSARTHLINDVPVVIATATSDHYVGDFAVLVHKLRDMKNIDVLFALARMEDRIYLVGRSRLEEVDVGKVALGFGGGGHSTAASATIRDLTLVQVEERLLEILREHIRPVKRAKDLMSSPVISIDSARTIKEAEQVLSRFNINVLPVMEGGRLVGLISRVMVQRATYHGLGELKVSEYMTTDFKTATPDTPLEDVRKVIVHEGQRFLPILEDGDLVGAITRTDILRDMQIDTRDAGGALLDEQPVAQEQKRRDVTRLMEEKLPPRVFELLRDIGLVAKELGMEAYVVGGFVRDLLLNRENLDIDVVIEGDGIRFAKHFATSRQECRCKTHESFGTALLLFPDGFKVDVATARIEYYERPAALPQVAMGSIKLDLYRRDFTMNALAIRLNPDKFGEVLDFFGGQRDIKDKTIRVLHNLSFVEDPTRILRAVRFEQRFGFRIGKQTLNLIQNALNLHLLEKVEGRRVWHELKMILEERRPLMALKRLDELGILKAIHSKLTITEDKSRLFQETEGVLAWHELACPDEEVESWRTYTMVLLDRLTHNEMRGLLVYFGLAPKETERMSREKYEADGTLQELSARRTMKPSEAFKLLQGRHIETLLYMLAKARDKRVKRAISSHIAQWRYVKPQLNGEDLKAMGFEPGPVFREILNALRDAKINGLLRDRNEEVEFVKRNYIKGPNE